MSTDTTSEYQSIPQNPIPPEIQTVVQQFNQLLNDKVLTDIKYSPIQSALARSWMDPLTNFGSEIQRALQQNDEYAMAMLPETTVKIGSTPENPITRFVDEFLLQFIAKARIEGSQNYYVASGNIPMILADPKLPTITEEEYRTNKTPPGTLLIKRENGQKTLVVPSRVPGTSVELTIQSDNPTTFRLQPTFKTRLPTESIVQPIPKAA